MMKGKPKIVYLLPGGLFNPGGMERITITKANYLAEKEGYDVSIVTTEQMGRPAYFPVSEKVHLYHLDIGMYVNFGKESYVEKCISRYSKNKEYKRLLNRLLCELRPDITISTLSGLDIDFIHNLKDGSLKWGELHHPRNFRQLSARKLSNAWIPNIIARIRTYMFRKKCEKLNRLIVLTQEEKVSWNNQENMEIIPNALSFFPDMISTCEKKQAIAVGRLVYEKGFDQLIETWKTVYAKHPDWELHIFGQGDQKEKLFEQIHQNGLETVVRINEPSQDIYTHYQESSFFVFPSRFLEALPMVLIEAMSCGLPLVAFDAPCGPKDIIKEGENGFLVKNGDIDTLSERIIQLMESGELRKKMGKTARKMSFDYSMDRIMKRWIELFHQNVEPVTNKLKQ